MLPLNAMRVFDAAARTLSFTRAADELAVTINLTLRPAVRTGERAHVAVLEDEAEVAVVEFDTGVVP